jgi:pre-mRNA-splicing factor SYF1
VQPSSKLYLLLPIINQGGIPVKALTGPKPPAIMVEATLANAGADDALADLLPDEADLLYEEELLRNPYSLKMWVRYLEARKAASMKKRYLLFERALNALPGSFKVTMMPSCCFLYGTYPTGRKGRRFFLRCTSLATSTHPKLTQAHVCVPQLWHAYLRERREAIRNLPINHPAVMSLNNTFERALVSMHKMPRIWIEYLELLVEQVRALA